MGMKSARGVRKINEAITENGRTLIITEEDASLLDWNEIPDGTLKINPYNGFMSIKLANVLVTYDGKQLDNATINDSGNVVDANGNQLYKPKKDINDENETKIPYTKNDINITSQTDWIPAGIKNDGTVCIAKDSMIVTETFTIVSADDKDGTFTYSNSEGELRHFPISDDYGYVFELEKGTYQRIRNHIDVTINDVLHRSAESGGLTEISEKRFGLSDKLVAGQEITARYIQIMHIGNPYPRIFINEKNPEAAEVGDLWIDTDYKYNKDINGEQMGISWAMLKDTPHTINGYGIEDKISYEGHKHKVEDISDFPVAMPANGGTADKAKYLDTDKKVVLNGDATGEAVVNGINDANLTVTVKHSATADMANDTKSFNGMNYDRFVAAVVSIGSVSAIAGVLYQDGLLPVPSGYTRNQCTFMAANSSGSGQVMVDQASGNCTLGGAARANYIVVGVKR